MAPKPHVDELAELDVDDPNNPFDLRAGSQTPLDRPITTVRFECVESENLDSWVSLCPYCGGEEHYHDAYRSPVVALGGISSVQCPETGKPYYLMLAQGHNINEVIIHARQQLFNFPGEELQEPLIPRGVDPRVIDTISNWTPGPGTKYE